MSSGARRQRELEAVLRNDLSSFVRFSFNTVAPGETFADNWHIDCIAWHLEQCLEGNIKRLIITLPPRHLKSICVSVAFPAWALGQNPTRKFICASYSTDLAGKHARDFRSVVGSDRYAKLFPGTKPSRKKDTELEFVTTKHGYRYATSVGGTLTGRGGNFVIIDDPMKPSEAMSEAERERVNQWYENTLYSRLDNKDDDVIVIVMQRIHVDDLVGHVLEKEDWTVVNIPAIAESEERYQVADDDYYTRPVGELLHAERESQEALDKIKSTLGSYNFAAQYQQTPRPLEGALIKATWLRRYEMLPDMDAFNLVVQSWDTASSAEELNDYSVGTTWGVMGSDYYLIDVVRERLEYPDLRRRVIAEAARYDADIVLIEKASSGLSLAQDLQMDENTPIKPIAIRPRGDKLTRMVEQTATIEANHMLLPRDADWLDEFENELLAFPNGRHDDQVDSMSQFLKWIRRKDYRQRPKVRPRSNRTATGPRPKGSRRRDGYRRKSGLYYRRGSLDFN